MSSDHRKPEDEDVDAFMRGEDATSRAYAETRHTQPPADLDTAVLKLAHSAARTNSAQSRLRRWQRPLSLAAVLALSMGVLLQLWKEPDVRNPVVAREELSRAESEVTAAGAAPIASADQAALAEPDIEITPQKPAAKAAKPVSPQVQPTSPPPPPAAAASAAAPPSVISESEPSVMSAPAPSPPKPESRSIPAPAMAPPPMDAMTGAAAGFALQDEAKQDKRSRVESQTTQRALTQRKEQSRAAIAAPQYAEPKQLGEQSAAWPAPVFDSLQLGSATRAEVRARYGEPGTQGLSSPDQTNPDRRDLHYDAYERLPGQAGLFDFYYERGSLRLLAVRRVLKPAVKVQTLVAELGWTETPVIRDWRHPPCQPAADPAVAGDSAQPPLYWLYPSRGAYLFLPAAGLAEQLVYEAECGPGY